MFVYVLGSYKPEKPKLSGRFRLDLYIGFLGAPEELISFLTYLKQLGVLYRGKFLYFLVYFYHIYDWRWTFFVMWLSIIFVMYMVSLKWTVCIWYLMKSKNSFFFFCYFDRNLTLGKSLVLGQIICSGVL